MSDKNDKKPDAEEAKTVFMPAENLPPAPPPRPKKAKAKKPKADAPAAAETPAVSAEPTPEQKEVGTAFEARTDTRGIKVGDVLNHIFEVKRFLARGGMGEVFEGCNVNSDEKVAIKVMLPQLAADEKVVGLFRREARTLTRLHHEALVQYRVLAQEPNLGVLYIVTEFIEGVNLADALGKITPTPEEQAQLLRRLASGLRAAHSLGAVHRDLSPDNVLLPDGKLSRAKIIDFGIAKDMEAGSATIVGDGFAGKLNYVAPEQLGDYGREIGPWTDIYSLGLVMLAVANGRNVDMSGSLVDAIDKRRKGPDMAKVPPLMVPVLEAMLKPDPAERLRSMDEVLAALDRTGVKPQPGEETGAIGGPSATPAGGVPRPLLIGGGIAAAAAIAAAAWFTLGRDEPAGPGIQPASRAPADVARAAIDATIPSVSCTWLEVGTIEEKAGAVRVAMRGVAGNGAAAQAELGQALTAAGVANATVDMGDVAPITAAGCAALDTFRQVRATETDSLSIAAPRFEMVRQSAGPFAGKEAVTAPVEITPAADADFAIAGIEPSGAITVLIPDRAAFERELAGSQNGRPIQDEGQGKYKLNIDLDHSGWSGIMLVTGKGPFDINLVQPPIGARGPGWQSSFLSAAAQRGWKAEMVWFETVNDKPD